MCHPPGNQSHSFNGHQDGVRERSPQAIPTAIKLKPPATLIVTLYHDWALFRAKKTALRLMGMRSRFAQG